MQTNKIQTETVYAYKGRYSEVRPAILLEKHLWRSEYTWDTWGGASERTKQSTYRRSPQGARAGSPGYSATNRIDGLPMLVISANEWRFTARAGDRQIVDKPSDILTKALAEMNTLQIVDEAHDGRKTDKIKISSMVVVDLVDGTTDKISISLELGRPQSVLQDWASFTAKAEAEALRKAESDQLQAQWKAESDKAAYDISTRLTQLLGNPIGGFDGRSERTDCSRKWTATGRSSTYEISQATLIKLIELAEKVQGE